MIAVCVSAVLMIMISIGTASIYGDCSNITHQKSLKSSGPIYINGNDDFVVGQNGVVSGNGTEGNPYIIENWDIDASTANGIEIRNTDKFFIIRNCTVQGGSNNYGIYFYNVTNGKIDNVFSYNNGRGIYLVFSSNSNITNCDIYNTNIAIYFEYSSRNVIADCTIHNNTGDAGVYFDNSNNNQITECILHNNNCGVYLYDSLEENQITDSILHNNSNYAIYVTYERIVSAMVKSYVYHNNFINNSVSAYDDSGNPAWDNGYPSGGNYWDDYTGMDANGDGIGDTPYNIRGGDNKDNYPLMHEIIFSDEEMPNISLTSPENNSVIKPGTVIDFNITDDNLWKAGYSINGGDFQLFSSDYNISTAGWSDGTYTITVYAKDWGMNENTETFRFTIDSILPTISLISPDNNSLIQPGTNLDFEINDVHLNITTYTVNNGSPQILSPPYNINTMGWKDGTYNITVWADDLAGNEISKTFRFMIDGTPPDISITNVTNGSYHNTNVTIFVGISDVHLNVSENIIILDSASFVSGTTVSSEGEHTLYVHAVDTAGNTASKTIIFIIDKTSPTITIISPDDGLITNQNVTLSYSFSDNVSSVENITVSGDESPYTEEGNYSIIITATDQAGNNASQTITFTIDKTPPMISVVSPADGAKTDKNKITVSGKTEQDAAVQINWVNVSVSPDGSFSREVILHNGYNLITITATDLAGNTVIQNITIERTEKEEGTPDYLIYLIPIPIAFVVALVAVISFLKRKIRIRCPACKAVFDVKPRKKPFKTECPKCGREGVLR